MGTENSRRDKIDWIRNKIEVFFKKKPKEAISKNKLLALFALEKGSTKRTGEEILKLIEELGFIKIKGDLIEKGK